MESNFRVANDNLTSLNDVTADCESFSSSSSDFLHCWSKSAEDSRRGGGAGGGEHFADLSPPSAESRGYLATIDVVLQWVLIPAICCLGILGNGLNILVLTRQRVRRGVKTPDQAVHVGLVSLAVSDMVVCLMTIPRTFVPEFQAQFEGHSLSLYYHVYSTGLISTFGLISTWLIIVTAAMRYVVICHPLLSRVTSNHRTGCLSIALTYVLCTVSNVPSFYLLTFRTVPDVTSPSPSSYASSSSFILVDLGPFSHTTRQGRVFLWAKAVISIFVPGLLLIFFNIRLIQALRQSDRLRQQHSHQLNRSLGGHRMTSRNRLTITLIAVVVIFICLVFPGELLDFFVHLDLIDWSLDRETVLAVRMILNALQLINFAFNFVLYCTLNGHFRRALRDWCCRRLSVHVTRVIRGRLSDNGNDVIAGLNRVKKKKRRSDAEGIQVVASHSMLST